MKIQRTWIMVLVCLSLAGLACGFPLPLVEDALEQWTGPMCGADEPAESCSARQAAYLALVTEDAVSLSHVEVSMYADQGDDDLDVSMEGYYDFALVETPDGTVPGLHGWMRVVSASLFPDDNGEVEAEVIIIGMEGYSKAAGDSTWVRERLDSDEQLGAGLLFGLPFFLTRVPDLFTVGDNFTVETYDSKDITGQVLLAQSLTVNLDALLSDPVQLAALAEPFMPQLAQYGVDEPATLIAAAPLVQPYLTGTELNIRLYIGRTDGLLHRFEQTARLMLDLTALDPDEAPMELRYTLSGVFQYGVATDPIEAPADYVEESGGLLSGVNPLK